TPSTPASTSGPGRPRPGPEPPRGGGGSCRRHRTRRTGPAPAALPLPPLPPGRRIRRTCSPPRPDGQRRTNSKLPPRSPCQRPRPPMRPLADDDPTRIGPYKITALLGGGGMGRVYLGFDHDDHPAAVKVVRAEYAYDPDFRERFAHELSPAQRVPGQGVPRVYSADTSGERPWLATAYVKGPSLQHLVERTGPLPEPSAVLLARAVAQALTGVHAQGLAHRDLKPANVMVAAEGPQVIDFGIARAAEDKQQPHGAVIAGTPGYMAPEASRGEQAGPPADVFALGGVLVWAL